MRKPPLRSEVLLKFHADRQQNIARIEESIKRDGPHYYAVAVLKDPSQIETALSVAQAYDGLYSKDFPTYNNGGIRGMIVGVRLRRGAQEVFNVAHQEVRGNVELMELEADSGVFEPYGAMPGDEFRLAAGLSYAITHGNVES